MHAYKKKTIEQMFEEDDDDYNSNIHLYGDFTS